MHIIYIIGLLTITITGFIIYRYIRETPRDRLVKSFSEKTRLANKALTQGDDDKFRDLKYEADFFLEMIKNHDASARKDRWR